MTTPDFLAGITAFGEGGAHARSSFDTVLARIRKDLVPWALRERDPLMTRHLEEGRHFGVDPDISRSISFSRDGRHLLTTSRGGSVTIRDAVTGVIVRDFARVRGEVFAAAFSPDATKVLAAGYWSPSRLLDVATGAELRTFPHGEGVQDVAFVDDARVLTAGDDGRLRLFDAATGRELRTFEGHERMVKNVLVAPGGRVVTAGSDETVRLWDVETGAALGTWKQPASIESAALAPGGAQVLLGLGNGAMHLVDLDGGAARVFEGPYGSVYGVAFVPDGRRILSVFSSGGSKIIERDTATGDVLRTWDSFHALTFHIAVAPGGDRFMTGDREGGLRVYTL
jgi:WD40 repeat protein